MIDIFSIFIWALLSFNVKVLQPDHIIIGKNDKVLLMGDSHVENLDYVISRLAKKDNIVFESVYVSGSSIQQWANPKTKGWDITDKWNQINQFKPTIILISLGSNDSYSGPNVITIDQPHLITLLLCLKKIQARDIIWIGPPKLARAKTGLKAFYQLIENNKIDYYDSRTIDIQMEPDQLHTTGKGRKVWGNWIWNKLTH